MAANRQSAPTPSSTPASGVAAIRAAGHLQRLALVAMLTFLEANGLRLEATDHELADWVIDLSADVTPEQLTEALRPRLLPFEPGRLAGDKA